MTDHEEASAGWATSPTTGPYYSDGKTYAKHPIPGPLQDFSLDILFEEKRAGLYKEIRDLEAALKIARQRLEGWYKAVTVVFYEDTTSPSEPWGGRGSWDPSNG